MATAGSETASVSALVLVMVVVSRSVWVSVCWVVADGMASLLSAAANFPRGEDCCALVMSAERRVKQSIRKSAAVHTKREAQERDWPSGGILDEACHVMSCHDVMGAGLTS